ncbi:hypothetical protein HA402_010314 [Bradysia odoriphaga]|nr:hypothetical protein HA402_010314 [Bradysia odoriphaga]
MASVPRAALKLYVGGLPWTVGHAELREFFTGFGRVISSNVQYNKNTGCSKGFAFVVLEDDGQVMQKLENNSLVLEGANLDVQLERNQ